MNRTELTEEQRTVLEVLREDPGLYLREIHQSLTEIDDSGFERSPDRGDGWNDERWTVQARVHELDEMGLAKVAGRGKPWYLTSDGRERVS